MALKNKNLNATINKKFCITKYVLVLNAVK